VNKMTIKSYKFLLPILLSILFFSSCEKETYVDYYIENQSSSVITVGGSDIIHSTDIARTINPNEKKNIVTWSKRGIQTDLFEPTAIFGNDLAIANASGDTILKDYKILANWTSDVDDNRNVAEHKYVLVVSDFDF
ncbi:hypothetical protein N9Q47_05250, partial [Vicingaceae bacterium]|nr:hypothetical protein [Vicingaceae bacterium]